MASWLHLTNQNRTTVLLIGTNSTGCGNRVVSVRRVNCTSVFAKATHHVMLNDHINASLHILKRVLVGCIQNEQTTTRPADRFRPPRTDTYQPGSSVL